MKILLVSATQFEVENLRQWLGEGIAINEANTRFKYKSLSIDSLITGIGMVAITYLLTSALKSLTYDLVINAGICGSFHRDLNLGTVVHVVEDSFSEIGAESEEVFIPFTELMQQSSLSPVCSLYNHDYPKFDPIVQLASVKGITVNTVHGNRNSIKALLQRLDADIESMEGAAVFYVCQAESIPCIQLRSVSNYVEQRDRSKWNIPLAVETLNNKLVEVVEGLTQS